MHARLMEATDRKLVVEVVTSATDRLDLRKGPFVASSGQGWLLVGKPGRASSLLPAMPKLGQRPRLATTGIVPLGL